MSKSNETLFNPQWLRDDFLAAHTSFEDVYFAEEETDSPAAEAMDALLAGLPPGMREPVQLKVVAFFSYREIAVWMGWFCGQPPYPNKKRAWRAVRDGLAVLRHQIESRDDLSFLDPGE